MADRCHKCRLPLGQNDACDECKRYKMLLAEGKTTLRSHPDEIADLLPVAIRLSKKLSPNVEWETAPNEYKNSILYLVGSVVDSMEDDGYLILRPQEDSAKAVPLRWKGSTH